MPPRKKTSVSKRRVSTPATSLPNVEVAVAPPPCTDPPVSAVEESNHPKTDTFLEKDQIEKRNPIMTSGSEIESNGAKEGESDPFIRARPAVRKAVVKKREVASVSSSENEAEIEKPEASKDESDCVVEETIEEKSREEVLEVDAEEEKEMVREGEKLEEVREGSIDKIGGENEIEEESVKEEVKGEVEKIEKTETEELANIGEIEEQHVEEGEPVEEEPVEEGEPVEEEPVEEGEPVEEEHVEEGEPVEEEPVKEEEEEEAIEEEHMEQEPVEEPMEEEEEEEEEDNGVEEEEELEEDEEKEEVLEVDGEEEEEEEDEEEKEKEEPKVVWKEDGKEEFTGKKTNEEKREIAANQDVQLASVDSRGERERGGEDQGMDVMPEPTMYLKTLLPNRRVKEAQIFISQLERTVVEEDLVKVFARYGEIQSVRVVRHALTQKSKGYAFLQYSTAEAVEKALSQLKDGTEIKGKMVHISASNPENCTLFVGNICKSWSKDQVLDVLKGLGVEGIEEITLPEDQKVEGKIKGFAIVEFSRHIEARAALNRLGKPDAVFGCDFSAKVSFAQFPVNQSGEPLAKAKTVYLERVPTSWDGKKIEEICKEYGVIETIKLCRKSRTNKKKDFAFVEFVSQESALNCVEGLNKAFLGHGDKKVSASIARPRKTGTKFVKRGNFKVTKSNENVDEEVKTIEVSRETKRKHKKPKLKEVIAQKSKALSPQKTIKKNTKVQKSLPNIEIPEEVLHRHTSKKRRNKEAPVLVPPQRSKKRPIKDAPESSKRPSKGKMKVNGMKGVPHPHQSGTKKHKPFKGSKQRQRDAPGFNNERAFKRPRNDQHGEYLSRGPPIDRGLSVKYGYAPPPYPSSMHEPPYTSRAHEPSRYELPYTSGTHEPSRYEPYAYASGSYHLPRSDMAPHVEYVPPTHHAPRSRYVYEPSGAPYGGGYDRTTAYPREPPIPPTSHPAYATYPRYQQPSYPYPTGGSYPSDYPPGRSYY